MSKVFIFHFSGTLRNIVSMKFFILILAVVAISLLGLIYKMLYAIYLKFILMPKTPLVNYHFRVEWGGTELSFSEVSGLSVETAVIEQRSGNSPEFHTHKLPGQHSFSNLILRRGITKSDNEFFVWVKTGLHNQVERRDINVSLLDENHNPIFVWRISNAFPVRYKGPELMAKGNDVAMEELELAYESFTVEAL